MVDTCASYLKSINLEFSTNANVPKSKTKCMAFLKKNRELKNMKLNGIELPWVKAAKHLGSKITDEVLSLKDDMMEKRALFINKANELEQEFQFAYPETKIKVNSIYNSSFYGAPLWNLFGDEAIRIEKTWNVSLRRFLGLPRNSHRFFLEPLSNTPHIMFSLFKRYVKFIDSVRKSKKSVLRTMLAKVKGDCRSNTGQNLRKLMKMAKKFNINDLNPNDFEKLTYNDVPPEEVWKISLAKEIIDVKHGLKDLNILSIGEMEEILLSIVAPSS